MDFPLVSLIVVTYNNLDHTKKVIECIKQQNYPNIEIVVVDGGSNDGTTDYLASLTYKNLVWISEKDKGIYDAINKGIRLSHGEVIGCCYDFFANDNCISTIVNTMIENNVDVVHGDLNYVDADGKIVRKWRMGNGSIKSGWMAAHPTLYIKKSVYDTYGLYKTDYRISADYELMVRLFAVNKVKLGYINEVLILMDTGGTSTSSFSSYLEGVKEAYRALKENNINFPLFITLCRFWRFFLQFFR